MATIQDLDIKDISSMSEEELLAYLQNSRKNRANPDPVAKAKSVKKAIAKKSKGKSAALTKNVNVGTMSPEMAAELLKKLGQGG